MKAPTSNLPPKKPKATSSNSGPPSSNPRPASQPVNPSPNSVPYPPQKKKSKSSTTSGLPLTRGEVSNISIKTLPTKEIIATTNAGKKRRIRRNGRRERGKILQGYEKLWKIV